MNDQKTTDLSPEAQAEWRRKQNECEVRRQYRRAGRLDDWEKDRTASAPLDASTLPYPDEPLAAPSKKKAKA